MRILVVSDCHGDKYSFFDAIKREPEAEVVLFLGDGFRDYEEARLTYGDKKAFLAVSGNCDLACDFPDKIISTFQGKRLYMTHGHNQRVKFGIDNLLWSAREENCDIVVFGHTHNPLSTYIGNIHILNPGALKDGFYGVIDITDKGIICINKSLVY